MYYVDAPTVTREFWTGTASMRGLRLHLPVHGDDVCARRLGARAGLHLHVPVAALPGLDARRAEHRRHLPGLARRAAGHGKRTPRAPGLGDCIDCTACVNACPTGVDIRDGVQLECINCGLCIDACNEMMEKTGQEEVADHLGHARAARRRKAAGRHEALRLLRPRTLIYVGALLVAVAAMGAALAMRSHTDAAVQHDRAPLFVRMRDGSLRNGYTREDRQQDAAAGDLRAVARGPAGRRHGGCRRQSEAKPALTLAVPAGQRGRLPRAGVQGRPRRCAMAASRSIS